MRRSIRQYLVPTAYMILLLLAAVGSWLAQTGQLKILSVQSDSMAPAIRRGNAVLIRKTAQALKPGDIVTYRSPHQPDLTFTHRVVSVNMARNEFIAKGDSSSVLDEPVARSAVVGTVAYVLPLAGFPLTFIRGLPGLFLLAYVPATALIFYEIKHYLRYGNTKTNYSLASSR